MKKVFLFLTSAMICAAMAACGGNNSEAEDTTAMEPAVEETEIATPATESVEANADARQQAIMDAAEQICNCGDITNCVSTVIDQSFEQYKEDADFKAAVKAEAEKCIANKVKDAALDKGKEVAKDAAKKGVEEGLKALKK